jgi:hypothetical protein
VLVRPVRLGGLLDDATRRRRAALIVLIAAGLALAATSPGQAHIESTHEVPVELGRGAPRVSRFVSVSLSREALVNAERESTLAISFVNARGQRTPPELVPPIEYDLLLVAPEQRMVIEDAKRPRIETPLALNACPLVGGCQLEYRLDLRWTGSPDATETIVWRAEATVWFGAGLPDGAELLVTGDPGPVLARLPVALALGGLLGLLIGVLALRFVGVSRLRLAGPHEAIIGVSERVDAAVLGSQAILATLLIALAVGLVATAGHLLTRGSTLAVALYLLGMSAFVVGGIVWWRRGEAVGVTLASITFITTTVPVLAWLVGLSPSYRPVEIIAGGALFVGLASVGLIGATSGMGTVLHSLRGRDLLVASAQTSLTAAAFLLTLRMVSEGEASPYTLAPATYGLAIVAGIAWWLKGNGLLMGILNAPLLLLVFGYLYLTQGFDASIPIEHVIPLVGLVAAGLLGLVGAANPPTVPSTEPGR